MASAPPDSEMLLGLTFSPPPAKPQWVKYGLGARKGTSLLPPAPCLHSETASSNIPTQAPHRWQLAGSQAGGGKAEKTRGSMEVASFASSQPSSSCFLQFSASSLYSKNTCQHPAHGREPWSLGPGDRLKAANQREREVSLSASSKRAAGSGVTCLQA